MTLDAQALAAYEAGNLEEAADFFAAAAAESDDPLKIAELSNSRGVVLLQLERPAEALEAVRGTPEVFSGAGDREREARAWGNLASAFEACDQPTDAEAAYKRAASLFEETGEEEERLATLSSLSQLQLKQHRPLEAAATLQAGGAAVQTTGLKARFLSFLLRIQSRLLRS